VDDLKTINFSNKDVLAGIAACGNTPYVIGGLEYAKSIGAKTIAIACSKGSPIGQVADVKIEVVGKDQ
jgi:N-acetylmuramic acid 6-phosphate etherase